ncbi:hypothetical protein HELRODRAFT_84941 [Helobdella robusta]|uniref:SH3 domain-containing GRB2-like protein n=1 Tax=Helobdella robusta TaxID=6412 RepID=T1G5Q7_HELRO|nr:hypothetical protein HELRODRAFT_84941 [Helobdella robusta]ESN98165.1 hypothetical protein HELRODRAFT_84941 [Helobdella robusta]
MSLAGLKKQINKANQYVSEKIGGAKGTELDDEFVNLEKKTDAMIKLIEEVTARTNELLQPNPAIRVKLQAQKSMSKLRGQTNQTTYPQPEGQLGECMSKYGRELGHDSLLGQSLVEAGDSYKQLADIKYSLEDSVHQNFLEPLQQLQNKDLKEVNFHRKKLHGRRLDFDCKKRRQEKGTSDEDIKAAEEKFVESKELAEAAMFNLLENEVEQLLQLSSFVEAELNYHRQSADILQQLSSKLNQKFVEASTKPKKEYVAKKSSFRQNDYSPTTASTPSYGNGSSGYAAATAATTAAAAAAPPVPAARAHCEALYDFEAENPGELAFKEGDDIKLISHIDENWLEGCVHGRTGYFPVTYVKIIVDTDNVYQG